MLPRALLFLLLATAAAAASGEKEDTWGQRLRANLNVDYLTEEQESVHRFLGNSTHKDFFKLLRQDGDSLLIGARNVIYNISLADLTENEELRITWEPTDNDRALCHLKGKSEVDCQNYIRVLARTKESSRLLVCGTNAYNPRCRRYDHNETHTSWEGEFSGKGFCPYDPRHNSTAIYTGDELYSGTVADFSATDSLIIKEGNLRTEQYELKHLNEPDFVNSLEDDEHVYFFFRESAVEHINCGKAVFSRVARVCKSDVGGAGGGIGRWTTFLKARLNCSVPGDVPFHFHEVQATTGFVVGDDEDDAYFYGVFTTGDNAVAGSAVCAFSVAEMNRAFEEGPFKNQASINSNWLPTSRSQVPSPRPGVCSNNNNNVSESALNFARTHPLVDWSVGSRSGAPVFVATTLGERVTVVAVDDKVSGVDGVGLYDVLFLGTSEGRIMKVAVDLAGKEERGRPVLVETMQVFPGDVPVRNVMITRSSTDGVSRLVALSEHEVLSLPLSRCSHPGADASCRACVALRDPYCAWDPERGRCVEWGAEVGGQGQGQGDLWQDLATGRSPQCEELQQRLLLAAELERTTTTTTTSPTTTATTATAKAEQDPVTKCGCQCPPPEGAASSGEAGEAAAEEADTTTTTESSRQGDDADPTEDDDRRHPFSAGDIRRDLVAAVDDRVFDFHEEKDSREEEETNLLDEEPRTRPYFQPIGGPEFEYSPPPPPQTQPPTSVLDSAGEMMYSEGTLAFVSVITALFALSIGVVIGYFLSKKTVVGGFKDDNTMVFVGSAASSDLSSLDRAAMQKPPFSIGHPDSHAHRHAHLRQAGTRLLTSTPSSSSTSSSILSNNSSSSKDSSPPASSRGGGVAEESATPLSRKSSLPSEGGGASLGGGNWTLRRGDSYSGHVRPSVGVAPSGGGVAAMPRHFHTLGRGGEALMCQTANVGSLQRVKRIYI